MCSKHVISAAYGIRNYFVLFESVKTAARHVRCSLYTKEEKTASHTRVHYDMRHVMIHCYLMHFKFCQRSLKYKLLLMEQCEAYEIVSYRMTMFLILHSIQAIWREKNVSFCMLLPLSFHWCAMANEKLTSLKWMECLIHRYQRDSDNDLIPNRQQVPAALQFQLYESIYNERLYSQCQHLHWNEEFYYCDDLKYVL